MMNVNTDNYKLMTEEVFQIPCFLLGRVCKSAHSFVSIQNLLLQGFDLLHGFPFVTFVSI